MNISATVQIGKNGLTDSVIEQISTSLDDHELVKVGVLKTADITAKGIIAEVAEALGAEPVQAIGNKIVLYRRSKKDGIEHIKLD